VERYLARDALLPGGWAKDVLVSVDQGEIVAVETGASGPQPLACSQAQVCVGSPFVRVRW